jgi:RNA polymerase sigma factor (sigma-70 family)
LPVRRIIFDVRKLEELTMMGALAQRRVEHDVKESAQAVSDGVLLERYLTGADAEAQDAFQALVVRHGPMVLGICRHILNEEHEAEDAFQATFLVLAQKGSTIRNRSVLAGWLHEVAHRIAIKARVSVVRRRTLERQAMAISPPTVEPDKQDEAAAWNELRPVLHAEVDRLPEKYRLPVILCYLEGKTNEEVAALLRWPVGSVKGRLSRARELLRSRLMRRGLGLSAAFLLTALSQGRVFAEAVPSELVSSTVRLAQKFGPRRAGLSLHAPDTADKPPSDLPVRLASLGQAGAKLVRGRRFLTWFLLSILVASMSVGVGLAATNSGGFSNGLRSAFSWPFSAGSFGSSPSCH